MKLSIAVSNRDRFDLGSSPTTWFLKSLENQTFRDFELVIADGGSKNIDEIKEYASQKKNGFPIRIAELRLGEKFERARMNNVGIRNASSPYILTTDVDMFFAPKFIETVVEHLKPEVFIESRTMYWKPPIANMIYSGKVDPFKDVELIKRGRIKKRTTAGGCQCANIEQWTKVRGFDEKMIQWGSEDYDLLFRMSHICKVVWLGESIEEIMLFHQPHFKSPEQIKLDIQHQNENKKLLQLTRLDRSRKVNANGWGGRI
ncbi:MAG: glycosyltransferase [Synergistaceae bacterium]